MESYAPHRGLAVLPALFAWSTPVCDGLLL